MKNNNNKLEILQENLHKAQKENSKYEIIYSYFELSKYFIKIEDFLKAKIFLNQILKINPKIKNVNYYLGIVELNLNNLEKAKKYFNLELKINSDFQSCEKIKLILEKIKIKNNLPILTFFLCFLNIFVFYFTYPQIDLVYLIKFGLNHYHLNLLNAFSSIFFHYNIYHLFFNIITFLIFGLILEKKIGSVKFLLIYIFCGIFGNYFQILFSDVDFVIGASSSIFGIVGSLMMLEPLLKIRLFGIFKISLILVLGSFFLINYLFEFFLSNFNFQIGNLSHFTGLIIGIFLTALFYKKTIYIFYNWIFIFFGFFLFQINLDFIIKQINFLNIYIILIFLFILIFSIFLISYSYINLKKRYEIKTNL